MKIHRLILTIIFLCAAFSLNIMAQNSANHIIISADVTSGKLKTFGELEASTTVGIVGTEFFAEDFGGIWELSGGKSVTFTFELPQGVQNVLMKVREVGYPDNAAEETLFIINDQRLIVPSAKSNTRKMRQFSDELAGKIRTGNNVIKVGVLRGNLGLQFLSISCDLPPVTTSWGDGMSLRFLSPVAGQVVSTNGEITISWESENLPSNGMVAVESRDGGNSWHLIAQVPHNYPSKKGNRGYIQWKPNSVSSNLQFRIVYKGNSDILLPELEKTEVNPLPVAGSTKIRQKDGMKMVYIPAGPFQMGSNDGESDEKPVHTVYLDAYYIDAYEVTNAQYRKFVEATGRREPEGYGYVNGNWQPGFKPWRDPNFNNPNQPVVCVSWEDAKAYAEWVGASLPTEAQWEKAARGGLVGKKFLWGDEFPPRELVGNFADESWKKVFPGWPIITGYDDGYAYTAPVGKFAPNGYGLYNMVGNVWEWCLDAYESDYYGRSPERNPVNDNFTDVNSRVVRGGTWSYYPLYYLRCASRYYNGPTNADINYGFRCCSR
ncbi:formylglycine-generating enzyme family protein [Candidatus Poribacteria bacterium]|nr:formylglycine-generating enzyme family protein [Candidatus Poribacteria bacterium]